MDGVIYEGRPAVTSRVRTPRGDGFVVGYVDRGSKTAEVVVSVNEHPFGEAGPETPGIWYFGMDQIEVV